MADLNWCTYCDSAVSPFSESLYCSEQCLRSDALRNHPLLGYTYPEFTDFPRPKTNHFNTSNTSSTSLTNTSRSNYSSNSSSPALTATSSQTDSSLLSLPKFDLLSTTTTTTNKINYFALLSTN